MKNRLLQSLLLYGALTYLLPATAATNEFGFGIIAPPLQVGNEAIRLDEAIEESNADNLAFVIVQGVKVVDEPCTDSVYLRRQE